MKLNKEFILGQATRGYGDGSIEYFYYFFFQKENVIEGEPPSTVSLDDVQDKFFKFIEGQPSRFKLLAFSRSGNKESNENFFYDEDELAPLKKDKKKDEERDEYTAFYQDTKANSHCIIKVIRLNAGKCYFSAASTDGNHLNSLFSEIKKGFVKRDDYEKETFFGVLYNDGHSLKVKKFPLNDNYLNDINLELNYGKGFVVNDKQITDKLKASQRGLFILHGESGTGKTTYIKKLAKQFGKDRTFIFIPTSYVDTLVSPNLLPVLLNHKNSILVLEDAEKAVVSRESQQGNESLVSTLLNIGDGILGSMLNISIMVTFNTKKERVDAALLRKGRLLYEYEFKPLLKDDAQKLINSLGKNYKAEKDMSLADIYNLESDTNHKEEVKAAIGFAAR